jgi:hypothetical protein
MSLSWRVAEFAAGVPTGRVEFYLAADLAAAAASVLYTRRLTDGGAFAGPTGRVVHSGAASWVIVPDNPAEALRAARRGVAV